MKHYLITCICNTLLLWFVPMSGFATGDAPQSIHGTQKIMWVDAYHGGLAWSDGIQQGIESVLEPHMKRGRVELQIIHMDTKNNPGDTFGEMAGKEAKIKIDTYQPDVIIACDDASAKYLIQPFLLTRKIPVVFCGINFDAAQYGLPTDNVTGIVEVPPVDIAVNAVKTYAPGDRLGYITFDDLSEKGNVKGIQTTFNLDLLDTNVRYVNTMDEWKRAYMDLQKQVDIIIMGSANFMQDWNWEDARAFVIKNTTRTIPVTYNSWTIDIALLAYSKRATEQGQWAATAALQILDGTSPKDIPISRNKEGDLLLNKMLADALDIQFTKVHVKIGKLITSPKNK